MNILEKEIEELIFEALEEDPDILAEKGLSFPINAEYERQPDFGAYGRPDVVGYTVARKEKGLRFIHVTIFEFKKEIIDVNTLMQAARYETAVRQKIKSFNLKSVVVDVKIILIGKTIQKSGDFVFLLNVLKYNVGAYTYKLSLSHGLEFEHHCDYINITPNFKEAKMPIRSKLKTLLGNHNPVLYECSEEEIS